MTTTFDYDVAFSRNLGWISKEEVSLLKKSTVAIAGLGGVGGIHLLTLTRLGIENFHIADFDIFEIQNFNRQTGADMTTLGRSKIEVMVERARNINPNLKIKIFTEGVSESNMSDFLESVDIYVDGLDVFALDLRESLFCHCKEIGIPAISVAPIGMGSAVICFDPAGMSFESYFGFKGQSQIQKYCRFILGLAPHFLHLKSLVDRSYADAYLKKAPSLPMGCEIASGIMGAEVLKHLCKRGKIISAPRSYQFDAYSNRLRTSWLPFGRLNPFFMIKLLFFQALIDRAQSRSN